MISSVYPESTKGKSLTLQKKTKNHLTPSFVIMPGWQPTIIKYLFANYIFISKFWYKQYNLNFKKRLDDVDVSTRTPDLWCIIAIPSKGQNILTRF